MYDRKAIEEQAERNAPYPKIEPSYAGMVGYAIAVAAVAIFLTIAGIDPHGRVFWASCVIVVGGTAGPYIYFNNLRNRHFREMERLRKISKERNA